MMLHTGFVLRLLTALLSSALLLICVSLTPLPANAAPLQTVCSDMQEEARAFDGRLGFVVIDLADWTRCSYGADEVFTTASLYKLLVLAEAYRQHEQGTFSFSESVEVVMPLPLQKDTSAQAAKSREDVSSGQKDVSNGQGRKVPRSHSVSMTSIEAARLMIQISDNYTAHALRKRLGNSNIAMMPAKLGMPDTSLRSDFTTTASDIAHFYALLHDHQLVGPESDATMLKMLLGQKVNDRIPWLLPDDLLIAHKTGLLDPFVHDAGIVYATGAPYLLVILTESAVSWKQGYVAIQTLAELSYSAFAEARPPEVAGPPYFADPAVTGPMAILSSVASNPLVDTGNLPHRKMANQPQLLIGDTVQIPAKLVETLPTVVMATAQTLADPDAVSMVSAVATAPRRVNEVLPVPVTPVQMPAAATKGAITSVEVTSVEVTFVADNLWWQSPVLVTGILIRLFGLFALLTLFVSLAVLIMRWRRHSLWSG